MEMKKKVCHLTSVHWRYDVRIFWKECKSLVKFGYDVSLIVADGMGDEFYENINIYDVGNTRGRLQRIMFSPKRIFEKAKYIDADIYHFHDSELIFIGLKLQKLGKKVIYDAHEDLPNQTLDKDYIPFFLRFLIATFLQRIENYAAKRLACVITVTSKISQRFNNKKINCKIIKNYALESEFLKIDRNNNINKLPCYIGAISGYKGINELLECTKQLDVKIRICGKFDKKSLEKKIKKKLEWKNIEYYGFINREKVQQILSHSSMGLVTLHPNKFSLDSLPTKMFEYMATGIPVIASNFPLWVKIIRKYNCGICINPLDPLAISDAINYLNKNKKEANEMGEKGRIAFKKKFNWSSQEKILKKLYSEL